MLKLKRNPGEGVIIGENAEIRLWWMDGESRVGFDADDYSVDRAELWLAKKLTQTGGEITPVIQSVINDMATHCPWRLREVDLRSGTLVKGYEPGYEQ